MWRVALCVCDLSLCVCLCVISRSVCVCEFWGDEMSPWTVCVCCTDSLTTHMLSHVPSHCQATPFRLFKTTSDDTEHIVEMQCTHVSDGCSFVASAITYKNRSDGTMKPSKDELQATMSDHIQTCQYAKCAPCDMTRATFRSHIMAACTPTGCSNLDCRRIKVNIAPLISRSHHVLSAVCVCVCVQQKTLYT